MICDERQDRKRDRKHSQWRKESSAKLKRYLWILRKIDKQVEKRIAETQQANEIANFGKDDMWPPVGTPPEQFELIPIGLYDGGELLPDTVILDDSYIVYLQTLSPEYSCEAIIP